MRKYKNIEAVAEVMELEDLLGRLNRDATIACKVQFMVITINHRPHRRGFWYKMMTELSLWMLHKVVRFYIVFPDEDKHKEPEMASGGYQPTNGKSKGTIVPPRCP